MNKSADCVVTLESLAESLFSHLVPWASMFYIAWFWPLIQHAPMAWIGFSLIWALMIFRARCYRPLTPQEAADQLYRDFGVVGRDRT